MQRVITAYRDNILVAAAAHGLDPDVVEAVVIQESAGRADAFRFEPGFYDRYLRGKPQYDGQNPRRIASSYGLMQVMYPTAQQYGFRHEPEMLFLPDVSLDYGCRHLSAMRARFGTIEDALEAYNGGSGGRGQPAPVAYRQAVMGLLADVRRARTRA